jgi:hypothetical protein
MEAGLISPHWLDLLKSSSELASNQAFNLAQAWLGSTGLDNTACQFMDNPVVDPFAIVTDHHNSSITKNAHLDQVPNNITYQKKTINDNGVATIHSGSFRGRYLDTWK